MPGPEILLLSTPGSSINAWACSKCRNIFASDPTTCPFCYRECAGCHIAMTKQGMHNRCGDCLKTFLSEQENKHFDAAKKVSSNDYNGYLFDDRREKYFETVDELLEYYHQDGQEPPPWVWATETVEFKLDASSILESALEEHHEDAGEVITTLDGNRLQKYLDIWAKKQGIVSYVQSYETVVMIDPETIKKYEADYGSFTEEPEQA
jgi:hypothetical protein